MNIYKYNGDGTEAGVTSIIIAESKDQAKTLLLQHPFFKTDIKNLWRNCTYDSWKEYMDNLGEDQLTLLKQGLSEGVVSLEDRAWD